MIIEPTDLHIYVDGSGRHQPRRGGISVRFVFIDGDVEKTNDFNYPGFLAASNNQMEVKACIQAFEELLKYPQIDRFNHITIFSDSAYVVNNQGNAVYVWPRTKYRKLSGGLVENADLWKEWLKKRLKLSKLLKGVRIEISWRNRRSNEHMKIVDNLAKASSRSCSGKPFRAIGVRRHKLPIKPGNVDFCGKKMTIHVVTAERMKVQGMNKYSCQVISKDSPYYRQKDIIHTPDYLREGRRYNLTCHDRPEDSGTYNIEIHRRYKAKYELKEGIKQ